MAQAAAQPGEMNTTPTRPRQQSRAGAVAIWVAASVAIIVFALILWNNVLKDRLIAKNLGVVEPGRIYRAGQISSGLIEGVLRENKIKTVVCLTADPEDKDWQAEQGLVKQMGAEWFLFPLKGDGTGDLNNYVGALTEVITADRAGKPVLIHCNAGAQRTGVAVAFYRLLVQHWPADQVKAELLRFGHVPRRNPDLIEYVNANRRAMAKALAAEGLIEEPKEIPELAAR